MPCANAGTATECVIRRRSLDSFPFPPKWDGPNSEREAIFKRRGLPFEPNQKALCYPAHPKLPPELSETIWINRQWWETKLRSFPARLYIYFHECAHLEGAKCEPCADRRAGELLKEIGLGVARDARMAALNTLENRSPIRAQNEIAEGFGAKSYGIDSGASWFPPQSRGLEHAERLEGVDASLIAFAHSVAIALNKRGVRVVVGLDGGLRKDAAKQLGYYNSGASEAKTLDQTPHGRGAAEDLMLYPPSAAAPLPDDHPAWETLADMARKAGFTTGADFPKPDRPHVQLKNWRDYVPNFSTTVKVGGIAIAAIAAIIAVAGSKK